MFSGRYCPIKKKELLFLFFLLQIIIIKEKTDGERYNSPYEYRISFKPSFRESKRKNYKLVLSGICTHPNALWLYHYSREVVRVLSMRCSCLVLRDE